MSISSGYLNDEPDVKKAMNKLSLYLTQIPEYYKEISSEELLHEPSPGKWSKKQILGHLIDSAINNLKRFTEIQFLPKPYKIISYRQNELVSVNDYQNSDLPHMINLWKALNQQIIFVVEKISSEKLIYAVDPQYDDLEIKTLAWVICDYVSHMEHHLQQIKAKIVLN